MRGLGLALVLNFASALACLPETPSITTQPTNQIVAIGSTVAIVANATGAPPLSLHWQFNGALISAERHNLYTNAAKYSSAKCWHLCIENHERRRNSLQRTCLSRRADSIVFTNGQILSAEEASFFRTVTVQMQVPPTAVLSSISSTALSPLISIPSCTVHASLSLILPPLGQSPTTPTFQNPSI